MDNRVVPPYTIRPAAKDDIEQIFAWRYPSPYDSYNLGEGPTAADLAYYLAPCYRFHVMVDQAGAVVAFCSFGEDGQVPGGDYSAILNLSLFI